MFTFKNATSDAMGVVVKTESEPVRAAAKEKTYDPAFSDGTIDYTGMTGYIPYADKIITLTLQFKASGLSEMRQRFRELARWLSGSGTLVIGDSTYENARVYAGINSMPQLFGHYAEFNVDFRVPPFAVEVEREDEIELDGGTHAVMLDIDSDQPLPMVIEIYCTDPTKFGEWGTMKFRTFEYHGVLPESASEPIVVDGEKMTVVYDGENYLKYTNMDFSLFRTGRRQISVQSSFDGKVVYRYKPKRFF